MALAYSKVFFSKLRTNQDPTYYNHAYKTTTYPVGSFAMVNHWEIKKVPPSQDFFTEP